MATTYVFHLDSEQIERVKRELIRRGADLESRQHMHYFAKAKGLTCSSYLSGKLMVQGAGAAEFVEFYLEPEVLGTFSLTGSSVGSASLPEDFTPHIGADESGKGDVFGPLCVAAVYADEEMVGKLKAKGVRDSKTCSPREIEELAAWIRENCSYALVELMPSRYNALYNAFKNLNRLLAWGHGQAISELVHKTGCHRATVDQFGSEHYVERALEQKSLKIELTQRPGGESDPVVAAASIVARSAFVAGLNRLSKKYGIVLHKGASAQVVEAGRQFVGRWGKALLPDVCKLHFRTVEKF